ncbi:MAG: capsular polysaccharide transport system ATP-binding protein [Alphaproteobacteria bacterium]|jgi:capsular polysaccharide transport system ATP-binding protein
MIKLKSVTKTYLSPKIGRRVILDSIDFEFPSDKNIGILGRNGAGKSTLMQLLSGSEMPDEGVIEIGKTKLSWPLGTSGGIHGTLTGRENILFLCRLYDYPFEKAFEFVEEFAELGDYMYVPVKNYSAGMKSRLGFGVSMILDFDTYLIDEGFSAGDASFRSKTKAVFEEKSKNSNLIVVSHNPATVKRLCDWAAVLSNGKLELYTDIDKAIEVYSNL